MQARVDWKLLLERLVKPYGNLDNLAEEVGCSMRALQSYRYRGVEPSFRIGETIVTLYFSHGFSELPRMEP